MRRKSVSGLDLAIERKYVAWHARAMQRLRPSPEVVEAKKREIAKRYRRRRKRSTFQMSAIRIAELNRLFEARHGIELPNDETGRQCVMIAAHHLILLAGLPQDRLMRWAYDRAPWLTVAEIEQILADVAAHPKTWRADSLAWLLKLTYADRQTLGIKTIGAIDCNKTQRAAKRRAAAKARAKAYRAAQKTAAYAT